MTEPYGTEHEFVSGSFTMAMTKRPEERERIRRAECVMAARAARLHEAFHSPESFDGPAEKFRLHQSYRLAVEEHSQAMLAFFDLEDDRG